MPEKLVSTNSEEIREQSESLLYSAKRKVLNRLNAAHVWFGPMTSLTSGSVAVLSTVLRYSLDNNRDVRIIHPSSSTRLDPTQYQKVIQAPIHLSQFNSNLLNGIIIGSVVITAVGITFCVLHKKYHELYSK